MLQHAGARGCRMHPAFRQLTKLLCRELLIKRPASHRFGSRSARDFRPARARIGGGRNARKARRQGRVHHWRGAWAGRAHAIAMAKEGADIIAIDICRQIESDPTHSRRPTISPRRSARSRSRPPGRREDRRCAGAPRAARRGRGRDSPISAGSTLSWPMPASSRWRMGKPDPDACPS